LAARVAWALVEVAASSLAAGAGEIEEMRALGLVELQGPGERFEHAVGDAVDVPTLDPGVVGDAEASQDGDLLASQAGDAAAAVGGQAGLLGGDLGPAGGQKLSDLASCPRARTGAA
jgi:hypothetical protein